MLKRFSNNPSPQQDEDARRKTTRDEQHKIHCGQSNGKTHNDSVHDLGYRKHMSDKNNAALLFPSHPESSSYLL
jgi:hypothetical protein